MYYMGNSMRNIFRILGPGIITAALVLGPGSLTIASKLGAGFRYQLIWVVILATFFMIIYSSMSARFGIASGETLIQVVKGKYGRVVSVLAGIFIFGVTLSFQTGNSIGAGLAMGGLFDTSPNSWIAFFSLLAIGTLFYRSFYKVLEKVMILMVIVMIFSFLFTLVLVGPNLPQVFAGFIPRVPEGSAFLSVALVASSFSLAAAFYQSYLVQEKGWRVEETRMCLRETTTGILILGIITAMVMMTAGAVLFDQAIEVRSVADLGKILEPLFGRLAFEVFMIGLFAASFSSLVGNATLGGAILADTFAIGKRLSDIRVRLIIMIIIVLGGFMAIVFSHLQLNLIVIAQALTIIMVPLVGLVIFLISNNAEIMGPLKNSRSIKFIGILGLILMVTLAVGNVYMLFII